MPSSTALPTQPPPRTSSVQRPVRGLIFDMDGLLIDSEPVWFEVEGSVLAEYGHEWTKAEAEACMGQGTPNTLRIWIDRYGLDLDVPSETARIIDKMIERAQDIPLHNGAMRMLELGKQLGLPMAVASSSPLRLIEAVVTRKGLATFFQCLVSGQDVPQGKPAPDVFLVAATKLGVPVEDCLVFEDSLAGCQAGLAAGARVMAVPTDKRLWEERLATWTVDDLNEAARIVQRLMLTEEIDSTGRPTLTG